MVDASARRDHDRRELLRPRQRGSLFRAYAHHGRQGRQHRLSRAAGRRARRALSPGARRQSEAVFENPAHDHRNGSATGWTANISVATVSLLDGSKAQRSRFRKLPAN
jgi:hypothetical protein